jgi:hypothetical protein
MTGSGWGYCREDGKIGFGVWYWQHHTMRACFVYVLRARAMGVNGFLMAGVLDINDSIA